jgi:exosortase
MKMKSILAVKTTQSGWCRQDTPALPQHNAWLFPLCAIGCYWAILIYYLGAQWSVYEQYNYGWAVPFLCLYLIWQRGRDNGTTGLRDYRTGLVVSGRVVSSPVVSWSLALCAFLYAPTRFLHEANPTWRLTSLLWTLEVIGLTLLTIHWVRDPWSVVGGETPVVTGPSSSFLLPSSRALAFPVCFFLVAVPWPSGLETFMVQSLMRSNVATTVELLGLFGIPAVQHANVIEIGTGVVGIDEACSGIRSLQATLMISLFLGELYRLTVRRRVGLVVLGFVLAFVFNVGRTLLLTGIASASGVGAVASWHDPAGTSILVACFLCLWLMAWAMQKAESRKQKAEGIGGNAEILKAETLKSAGQPISFSAFQRLSICLTAWLLLVEGGTELWYRAHERGVRGHAEWSLPRPNDRAVFQVVEIPPGIRGQFRYDEGIEGRWQDANGGDWQLYYFRWFPAHSLSKRVAIQLAKTHGPEKCLPAAGMRLKSDLGITLIPLGGLELAVHQYVFEAEGRILHVFYGIYEDQGGAGALVNRRLTPANRLQAALSGSRNYGQRFLEVAVYGYESPEAARAAFAMEMANRIKVGA